jgi:hypothetical protein
MNNIILTFAVLFVAVSANVQAQKVEKKLPADGAVFTLKPESPKWVTADIEFRDASKAKWPNFFYGKPAAAGTFTWNATSPTGQFTVRCDKMAQKQGDQSRKVLAGKLAAGTVPVVEFTFESGGTLKKDQDAKGKPIEMFPFTGKLVVGDAVVKLAGTASIRWQYAKDADRPESVQLTMTGTVKGSPLNDRVDTIDVTVSVVAYAAKK